MKYQDFREYIYQYKSLEKVEGNTLSSLVEEVDESCLTLLSHAVLCGNFEACKLLISHGSNVNIQDSDGNTPLIEACLNSYYEIVKLLLKSKANPNISNSSGETPISSAASIGCLVIIDLLVEHGADVNTVDNLGSSPLMWALSSFCVQAAYRLIEYGALVDTRDNQGLHTIQYSLKMRDSELIKELLGNITLSENTFNKIIKDLDCLDKDYKEILKNSCDRR